MPSIGLALSGGGFRATLYHLGVIRYLRDSGALPLVADIAAVSGGSIVAAHLVLNWDRYNGSDEEFAEAAAEVIRFVQFDVRNHIVRRLPLLFPLRYAARLTGWPAAHLAPNSLLERHYREFLYGDRRLFELPKSPGLHILATNVSDGVLSVFNRDGLHIQKRDLDGDDPFHHVPGWTASIAKVVGASSAFPGFFPPVEITAADLGVRDGHFPTESFTDGGVYDNLGIRAFRWLQQVRGSPLSRVFVSDAGKPFQILGDTSLGFLAQSIRATDILWDRVWQLERENFGDQNGFHFVPITRVVPLEEDPHALHPVLQAEVSSIRTDLDRFSDLEVNTLVGHGYEVARSIHRRMAVNGESPVHEGPVWLPLPGDHAVRGELTAGSSPAVAGISDVPERSADGGADVGNPSPAGHSGTARTRGTNPQAVLATTLRRSSRRKVWSTLLDFRDWPSWIYLALGLLFLVWLPIRFWQMHRHDRMLTSVINSIAKGDPDIRLVLDLVENDPLRDWRPIPVTEADELAPAHIGDIDVLSRSRIIDLRKTWVGQGGRDGQGVVQMRDRLTLRIPEGARDPSITLRTANVVRELDYRQPRNQPQISVRRGFEEINGEKFARFELTCDLASAPRGVPVTIELATHVRFPKLLPGRMPFLLEHPTDLLTVWMLFPEDHPYHTYNLLRHPRDEPDASEPLSARYTIDHPYGTLIGWSVIKPDPGTVYECRWTND
jgi:predicted acylesterase/phospholipase RssA